MTLAKRLKRDYCNTKERYGSGDEGGFSILSPKLSAHLIEQLAAVSENQAALDTALSLLPTLRRASNNNWGQEDAIQSAMIAFGIRNAIPNEVVLKHGASSGLSLRCYGPGRFSKRRRKAGNIHCKQVAARKNARCRSHLY